MENFWFKIGEIYRRECIVLLALACSIVTHFVSRSFVKRILLVHTRAFQHNQVPENEAKFLVLEVLLCCSLSDMGLLWYVFSSRSYTAIHCRLGIRRSDSLLLYQIDNKSHFILLLIFMNLLRNEW